MKIPIVNEKDEIVYYKEKHELLPTEINRDTGLFVLNEKNQILLAQRSSNKKMYPNLWSVAVAGTVEEGETYESNIIKEAQEELGLLNIKPIFMCTYLNENKNKRMSGMFKIIINSNYNFKIEPKEISEIKWFSHDEIKELFLLKKEMFTPNFPNYYKKFLDYENKN